MLELPQRLQRELLVQVVRHEDRDGVGHVLGERLGQRRIGRAAGLLGHGGRAGWIGVDAGRHLRADGGGADGVPVPVGDGAAADQGEA